MTAVLGLPAQIRGCLFDLDGVLTPTAEVHAAAWKETFDSFLREYARSTGEPFVPFDAVLNFEEYVDGRRRADGAREFLASRHITVPQGSPADPPGALTVEGLGARKDQLFEQLVRRQAIRPYPGSLAYLRAARDAGLRRAVVSASRHCAEILHAAGIEDLLEERVDGIVAEAEGLPGKPAPDMFLAAARRLGVPPAAAAIFEDALAGVAAGRAGGFGFVVGVDRVGSASAVAPAGDGVDRVGGGHARELREHGADVVVTDLAALLAPGPRAAS